MTSASDRLLQPLWNYIRHNWGNVVSLWFFPTILGWVIYVGVGFYFMLKDVGPFRSEATRLHKGDDWPSWYNVMKVGGIQAGVYALINLVLWFCFPFHLTLPELAPTVLELMCDFWLSMLTGDFLVYLEHLMHHKMTFLYKHVHHVHHRFKTDLFSWCAGWVHPFELMIFAFCMIVYPWILFPVHPLTLWCFCCSSPWRTLWTWCMVVTKPTDTSYIWWCCTPWCSPHQSKHQLWVCFYHLGSYLWYILGSKL